MASKRIKELQVQFEDESLSEEAITNAVSQIQKDFLQLAGVAGVRPKPKTAPRSAKPVEPTLLGALLVKLIASGGALAGIVSVARSWIKGRASLTVTIQYGKDKLVIKGASSREQEKAFSEWINRQAKSEAAPVKSKGAPIPTKQQMARKQKQQSKPKRVAPTKKGVRRSS